VGILENQHYADNILKTAKELITEDAYDNIEELCNKTVRNSDSLLT